MRSVCFSCYLLVKVLSHPSRGNSKPCVVVKLFMPLATHFHIPPQEVPCYVFIINRLYQRDNFLVGVKSFSVIHVFLILILINSKNAKKTTKYTVIAVALVLGQSGRSAHGL